jgi:hypothetical protein
MHSAKLLTITFAAVLVTTASLSAYASQEERVDCYAQVHESCYPGGGEPKCSQTDYNDALDICDSFATDDGQTERPHVPGKFAGKTTKSDPAVIARIKAELKRSFGR